MIKSNIPEFYKGRSVFITGATGFMGKVLVEKLLRSCPDVGHLYLLMRPAKGMDVSQRLQDLINNQIFDNVRQTDPRIMEKVSAVVGDVTLPGFGLSSTDLQLLIDNVSIVFNSAATVKFDEELKAAVEMNVKGPRQLLEICRQMKNLDAFIHVSTAFNNLDREEMKEEVYPSSKVDPGKLVEFIDCLDETIVKKITNELVGKCPNTYTYTKALAEELLERECGTVPLAIVRPSIVTAAIKEPIPGWVDNLNGATGTISAVGKGFLRIMKIDKTCVADMIPVDYPINLMIAVAWYTATHKPNEVAVYSCTTGHRNPLTWGMLEKWAFESWLKYPPKEMMWYPSSYFTTSDLSFKLNTAIFQQLPAYFLDTVARMTGQRVKWIRMYERADRAFAALQFFTTHQWRFISNNPILLMEKMSARDRDTFYFDVRDINWERYFETYILGARRFILKDDPSTLSLARSNLNRLFMIKMMFRIFLFTSSLLTMSTVKRLYGKYALLKRRPM